MNLIPKSWSIAAAVAAAALAWLQVNAVVSLADKPPIAMARGPLATPPETARASAPVPSRTSAVSAEASRRANRG